MREVSNSGTTQLANWKVSYLHQVLRAGIERDGKEIHMQLMFLKHFLSHETRIHVPNIKKNFLKI